MLILILYLFDALVYWEEVDLVVLEDLVLFRFE